MVHMDEGRVNKCNTAEAVTNYFIADWYNTVNSEFG